MNRSWKGGRAEGACGVRELSGHVEEIVRGLVVAVVRVVRAEGDEERHRERQALEGGLRAHDEASLPAVLQLRCLQDLEEISGSSREAPACYPASLSGSAQ